MDGNISTDVGLTNISVSINVKYIVAIFILFLILDYSYELFEIINMRLLLHFQKIGCALVFKIWSMTQWQYQKFGWFIYTIQSQAVQRVEN